jgi:hypothetical protein
MIMLLSAIYSLKDPTILTILQMPQIKTVLEIKSNDYSKTIINEIGVEKKP